MRFFTLYYYLFYIHRTGQHSKLLLFFFCVWRRNILFFSSLFFQFLNAIFCTHISFGSWIIKSVCIELKIDFMDFVIFLRNFFFTRNSLGPVYTITSICTHILCFSITSLFSRFIKTYLILYAHCGSKATNDSDDTVRYALEWKTRDEEKPHQDECVRTYVYAYDLCELIWCFVAAKGLMWWLLPDYSAKLMVTS